MTSTEFTIDTNIPLPPVSRGPKSKGACKYPLHQMEVGDSFFIGGTKSRSINSFFKKLRPKRFTTRRVVENETSGVRVWRFE